MRLLLIIVIVLNILSALGYLLGYGEPTVAGAILNNIAISFFAAALMSEYPKQGGRK